MNVMLQRRCARYIYVVPDGLRELMTDISREVIRIDPENTYTYIADYLDALLITRENARVAARLVQSITEIATTTVDLLSNAGMVRSEADRIVSIIEASFRKHIQPAVTDLDGEISDEYEEINIVTDIIDQAQIPPEVGEVAAKIIQQAFRRFKIRKDKERELLIGMVDWRIAARSAIRLYRKTGVTYEEANRAATLIKAAYKGYYTRRFMRKLAEERKMLEGREEQQDFDEEDTFEHDQKFVTIDYGSIIPHVDFDEPKVIEESISQGLTPVESTVSTVVYSVTEGILDATLQEVKRRELLRLEDDVKSDKELYIEKIQEEMMEALYQHEEGMFPVKEEPELQGDGQNEVVAPPPAETEHAEGTANAQEITEQQSVPNPEHSEESPPVEADAQPE